MEKTIFISVDNNYELYKKCILHNTYIKNNPHISCVCFDNTKENEFISKRYNHFIDNYNMEDEAWLVFCHNDWEIKEDITVKLLVLDKTKLYGPIGTVVYEKIPGLFFHEFRGECRNKQRDGKNEILLRYKNRETGVKVDTFDCQCLIVHSSLLKKHRLRFDERLEFDLYVEEFCINAKINYGIESHILNIYCSHWSPIQDLGDRPSYWNMLKYMNVKYKDYLFSGTCSLIGNDKYKNSRITVMSNVRSTIYKLDVDLQNENDARALIANNYVTYGANVLDVGCACGDLGVALHNEKNATVVGMEYDQGSVEIALQTNAFEDVHRIDLNNFTADDFKQYHHRFDYIVFGDILEHIMDPQQTIEKFKIFLKNGGAFLVSFPNISHASIKMNLLIDDWTYTETGILDKTHIKFFTYKSIARFLAEIGLRIVEMKYTTMDKQGFQPNAPWKELPSSVLRAIHKNPHSFVVQYVLKIIPDAETHYSKTLETNIEKLSITKENTTYLLKKYMSKESSSKILKKLRRIFYKKKQ